MDVDRSSCRGVLIVKRNKHTSSIMEVSSRATEQVITTHELLITDSKDRLKIVRHDQC